MTGGFPAVPALTGRHKAATSARAEQPRAGCYARKSSRGAGAEGTEGETTATRAVAVLMTVARVARPDAWPGGILRAGLRKNKGDK